MALASVRLLWGEFGRPGAADDEVTVVGAYYRLMLRVFVAPEKKEHRWVVADVCV